jgi:hypothetical protein
MVDDPALLDRVLAAAARERHAERRSLQRWRVGAGLAAVVALLLGVLGFLAVRHTTSSPPSATASAARPVAVWVVDPSAGNLNGTVQADPKGWGTSVQLQLWDLPQQPEFVLMVVAKDGRRQQAAAWSITSAGQCIVTGATSIQASDIDHFEITTPSGPVLAQAPMA